MLWVVDCVACSWLIVLIMPFDLFVFVIYLLFGLLCLYGLLGCTLMVVCCGLLVCVCWFTCFDVGYWFERVSLSGCEVFG